MGHCIQCSTHVWRAILFCELALCKRFRGIEILQGESRGSVGHLPILPLWGRWAKLHLPNNQPLWFPDQHDDHHHSQIHEHRRVLRNKQQSLILEAVGKCYYGLRGALPPNLPQVEEKESMRNRALLGWPSLLFFFD